jgi:uroporphyrin-3 C-methyltransferase
VSEKDADNNQQDQGQEEQCQSVLDQSSDAPSATEAATKPSEKNESVREPSETQVLEHSSKHEQEKEADTPLIKEKTANMKKNKTVPSSNSDASKNTGGSEKTKTAVLNVIALPLAIVAMIGSAYIWQQSQMQQNQTTENISSLQRQLQQQQQSEQTLRSLVDKQNFKHRQERRQLTEKVNALYLSLNVQKKRLQSLATTDREDWLLAESEYLMRLANQRLLMGKELQGAADLLAAADDILKDFDDAALYGVRKILAQEITALKSAARLDLEGVYLRLDAMATQVDQMGLFKAPQLNIQSTEQTAVVIESWQQRIESSYQQAKNKLAQYIQIKRRDKSYRPLLAPEKEAVIRHSLRLMFEQAQLALLAGKQQLYDQSLDKSQRWVNDYFAIDEQQVAIFNGLIEKLKQQAVTVDLPDISASSRALKNYIETIHEIPKKKSEDPKKEEPKVKESVKTVQKGEQS